LNTLTGFSEGLAVLILLPVLGALTGGSESFMNMGASFPTTTLGLFLVVALVLASSFFRYLAGLAEGRLSVTVEQNLRNRSARLLLNVKWEQFIQFQLGRNLQAIVLDGMQAGIGIRCFSRVIGLSIICSLLAVTAFLISPVLTLIAFLYGSFLIFGSRYIRSRADRVFHERAEIAKSISSLSGEVFGHLKLIKSTGSEMGILEKLTRLTGRYTQLSLKAVVYQHVFILAFEWGGIVFATLFFAFGHTFFGQSLAEALVFLGIFYRLGPRAVGFVGAYHKAKIIQPWVQSWFHLCDRLEQSQVTNGKTGSIPKQLPVHFRNVSFSYQSRLNAPILKNINFEIPFGRCIGISGDSGAGKTTILDLLTGIIEPSSGAILVGGMELSDLNLDAWRRRLGVVIQSGTLFHGTILENIALGRESILSRAKECAEMANVCDFIEGLPQKFETRVGEKGYQFSGGQGQRIALARALYADPEILILDEPTSALDKENAFAIYSTLKRLRGSLSILMITHNEQLLALADEIYILQRGSLRKVSSPSPLPPRLKNRPALEM